MDKCHPNGTVTYTAGGAITKGNVVKFSAAGTVVKTTAATDAAVGVAIDDAESGAIVPVAVLGSYTGTVQILAAGAITVGAEITAAATATSATTDLIVGRALEAGVSGDMVEIAHKVAAVK